MKRWFLLCTLSREFNNKSIVVCLRVCLRQLDFHTFYGVDLRGIHQSAEPTFLCHSAVGDSQGQTPMVASRFKKRQGNRATLRVVLKRADCSILPGREINMHGIQSKRGGGVCGKSFSLHPTCTYHIMMSHSSSIALKSQWSPCC